MRRSLQTALALLTALALALPLTGGLAAPLPAAASAGAAEEGPGHVADLYHDALLRHTRWAEQQWDPALGRYRSADFRFAVVLGNAVLLTRGGYDAAVTGVPREELHRRTVATIAHYAASNRLNGGTEWGRTLFWDTTFQSYFVLAARLLWDDLDEATRAHVDTIAREQAEHTAALGTRQDPASGGWTTNGLAGGHRGDTKAEEMGVYAQALAPGVAWAADDARAASWRDALGMWTRNATGQPEADRANPTVLDGVPVSSNQARNLHRSFVVENHGSFGPHYQQELWRTSGRNAIHFLLAGEALPQSLVAPPNGEQLWDTILSVMSDAGEPLMPLVDDREHLYGRDVLPLAYLSQVQGDRYAAAAELALAERLEAYQAHEPADRLTKFSGEPKYEPEARAELAISYLLHEWRAEQGDRVEPATTAELFARASGATDHGADVGMLAHQSPAAWAGTITKPGFVKLAWQPGHDDWFLDVSGATPSFLPSTSQQVLGRSARAYTPERDGFDGTASLLRLGSGTVGTTTLPTGTVVYATTGTGAGEGVLSVRNLDMPGMPGLDGTRTYTTAEGTYTSTLPPAPEPAPPLPPGVARLDDVTFAPTTARHVRILGVEGHPQYGYSVFELEARDGSEGANLALGRPATASSADGGRPASAAVDGSTSTRWAVSRADRTRADSWLAVDLGAPTALDRVRVLWESAAAAEYRVQVSDDGSAWRDVATRVEAPAGVARVDDHAFDRVDARYVRMQGVVGAPTYGYSLWDLEVRDGAGTPDLARGTTATASSADPAHPAARVVDGNRGTRWAVAREERGRGDSWVQVDLGAVRSFDRVRLLWEAAAGQAYRVQVSADGQTWADVSSHGDLGTSSDGGWLAIDDRAGLVVRGSQHPLRVTSDRVVLSDGDAAGSAGMVVEGYAGIDADATRSRAERPAVTTSHDALRASDADGWLSLFNLSEEALTGTVDLPGDPTALALYAGRQTATADGTAYAADLAPATAALEPPRFVLRTRHGGAVPPGTTAEVLDGQRVHVTAPAGADPLQLTVEQVATGERAQVTVPAGQTREAAVRTGQPWPLVDLAAGRMTFPTSPLPAGMTPPRALVDADACTTWAVPAGGGRAVVDLGAEVPVGGIAVDWADGELPAVRFEVSTDGAAYAPVAGAAARGRTTAVALAEAATARYVAVVVEGDRAEARALRVLPPGVPLEPTAPPHGGCG